MDVEKGEGSLRQCREVENHLHSGPQALPGSGQLFSGPLAVRNEDTPGRLAHPRLEEATAQGCGRCLPSGQPGSSPMWVYQEDRQGPGGPFQTTSVPKGGSAGSTEAVSTIFLQRVRERPLSFKGIGVYVHSFELKLAK